MTDYFDIPDKRSPHPDDYRRRDRRGQMKRSWKRGVKRQRDGQQVVSIADGLTWGSIGQILGYLLGVADEAFKNEIYERMVEQFAHTDRGSHIKPALGLETRLNVGTWNLRYSAIKHSWRRLHYIKDMEWDVIALQEVSQKAWRVFQEDGLAAGGYYALEGLGEEPRGTRSHGAAILVRNGFKLTKPRLIPGLPQAERALAVDVTGLPQPVTFISWHAPNAAGQGVKVKMAGYRGISEFLEKQEGPTVIGFDSNHWSRRTELESPEPIEESHRFYLESRFFSKRARHGLSDALIEYFSQNELAYRRAVHARPDGPLAVSYIRGSAKNPVEDRFDYIFASSHFRVIDSFYDYEGAAAAGSDHGFAAAELVFDP